MAILLAVGLTVWSVSQLALRLQALEHIGFVTAINVEETV